MLIVRGTLGRTLVREARDLMKHLTKSLSYAKMFKLTSKVTRKL